MVCECACTHAREWTQGNRLHCVFGPTRHRGGGIERCMQGRLDLNSRGDPVWVSPVGIDKHPMRTLGPESIFHCIYRVERPQWFFACKASFNANLYRNVVTWRQTISYSWILSGLQQKQTTALPPQQCHHCHLESYLFLWYIFLCICFNAFRFLWFSLKREESQT